MNNTYRKDRSYIKQRLEYVSPVDYIIELEEKIEYLEEENEILKEQKKKAIEWVKKHIETYQKNEIVILDWDNFSDPRNLLKILKGSDKDENN